MSSAAWWVVIAAACIVGELLTGTFVLLALALGAGAAAIGAAVVDDSVLPVVLFAAGSAAFMAGLVPVRRRLDRIPQPKVGASRLVGITAVVLETVTDLEGRVKVESEEWQARTSGPPLAPGTRAVVVSVEGTRLFVAAEDMSGAP